ncbi:4,5-dihydroxyphthalate decarboxylase [Amycolatopsis bartoniae]|uniref:4,5-dihydroxyphthalate decarboxylase n=1 Tax=Amycolatopsis bartoniae TaxID=941986 RepID=A0A8H9IVD3_9PSEU|nr:4,5-dihydroxyphthalate decarboxylase [Amycolatopsis bartoniae]MBB2938551.1 4,5-dihydroxyphthalate decarboxylase [Amycolatopsis bartoniae]TVT10310.1 4,5-dihydroxyphthalate decarboxylase [Amycolatopsis bartoniae]GHF70207.1 4,5-dihydroxyphthalate decarboxylase [Amycolatopsis bartoniae]
MSAALRIATSVYEHTEALFDGRVRIDGAEATFESAPLVSDIFRRMAEGHYDVAEYGLTYFLRTFDLADSPFLALPVFPNRNFRHSAVFVNTAAGIERPEDLAGRTIGEFALFGHDPGVWIKGIFSDEHGLDPGQARWVIGGTDHPIPAFDWVPQPVPDGVDVRHAGEGETLGAMLESGEIDALISVDVPRALLNGSPKIARLFPGYETVERDYYRRTGIFPPMHVVAVPRELATRTGLMKSIYRAFCDAKEITQRKYRQGALKQHMAVVTPWFSKHFEENRALLGEDWWPYGVAANRKAVDTFLRYHHEQGLSKRLLTSEDIFVPALLDT